MNQAHSVALVGSLFAHAAWANAAVLTALRHTPGTDPQAVEQFAHVLGAEAVWLARIRGEPQAVAVWPRLSLDDCERLAAKNRAGFAAVVADATEASLEREVTYTNSAGLTFTNRVLDILLQVALHGAYHRGITSILTRRGGGTPAPTDFIAWVRGVPTATRSDAERGPRA
jgi:uncharacterized damage-inducible protein DinB